MNDYITSLGKFSDEFEYRVFIIMYLRHVFLNLKTIVNIRSQVKFTFYVLNIF